LLDSSFPPNFPNYDDDDDDDDDGCDGGGDEMQINNESELIQLARKQHQFVLPRKTLS